MESRAILRIDIGFCKGTTFWVLVGSCLGSMPFGLTRSMTVADRDMKILPS